MVSYVFNYMLLISVDTKCYFFDISVFPVLRSVVWSLQEVGADILPGGHGPGWDRDPSREAGCNTISQRSELV